MKTIISGLFIILSFVSVGCECHKNTENIDYKDVKIVAEVGGCLHGFGCKVRMEDGTVVVIRDIVIKGDRVYNRRVLE